MKTIDSKNTINCVIIPWIRCLHKIIFRFSFQLTTSFLTTLFESRFSPGRFIFCMFLGQTFLQTKTWHNNKSVFTVRAINEIVTSLDNLLLKHSRKPTRQIEWIFGWKKNTSYVLSVIISLNEIEVKQNLYYVNTEWSDRTLKTYARVHIIHAI